MKQIFVLNLTLYAKINIINYVISNMDNSKIDIASCYHSFLTAKHTVLLLQCEIIQEKLKGKNTDILEASVAKSQIQQTKYMNKLSEQGFDFRNNQQIEKYINMNKQKMEAIRTLEKNIDTLRGNVNILQDRFQNQVSYDNQGSSGDEIIVAADECPIKPPNALLFINSLNTDRWADDIDEEVSIPKVVPKTSNPKKINSHTWPTFQQDSFVKDDISEDSDELELDQFHVMIRDKKEQKNKLKYPFNFQVDDVSQSKKSNNQEKYVPPSKMYEILEKSHVNKPNVRYFKALKCIKEAVNENSSKESYQSSSNFQQQSIPSPKSSNGLFSQHGYEFMDFSD